MHAQGSGLKQHSIVGFNTQIREGVLLGRDAAIPGHILQVRRVATTGGAVTELHRRYQQQRHLWQHAALSLQ